MTSEREIVPELLDGEAGAQSGLLMIVVGASALFWGIVYFLFA